jgi:ribosomal protein L17
MNESIAELNEEYRRIHGTWEHAGIETRQAKLKELKSMLEQLWQIGDVEALDLRRRVRALIDEAEHAIHREQAQRQTLSHNTSEWWG